MPVRHGTESPHGHGTVHASDGGYYQGGFRNGLHHGWATVRTADGRTYRAEFRDGQQVGKAILMEGVAGNDPWKDPWKEETGQSDPWGQEDDIPPDSGSTTGAVPAGSPPSDRDQGDDADYSAALESLDGGDGVVRVATPDEYAAALTALEEREAELRAARDRERIQTQGGRSAQEVRRGSCRETSGGPRSRAKSPACGA